MNRSLLGSFNAFMNIYHKQKAPLGQVKQWMKLFFYHSLRAMGSHWNCHCLVFWAGDLYLKLAMPILIHIVNGTLGCVWEYAPLWVKISIFPMCEMIQKENRLNMFYIVLCINYCKTEGIKL